MADVDTLVRTVNRLRIQADGTAQMEAELREARYHLALRLGSRGPRTAGGPAGRGAGDGGEGPGPSRYSSGR